MTNILVTIYVLSLDESYDLLLPINVKVVDVLDMIQNTLIEMSSNNYVKHDNACLINIDGNVINNNNLVRLSGLKNGCKVVLL